VVKRIVLLSLVVSLSVQTNKLSNKAIEYEPSASDIRGTLYDADGNTIGQPDAQFFAELGPREAVFKSQGSISNIIGSDWPGRASLVLSTTYDNLRLMNLNFVNNEIYFNFSCYLTASDQGGN